MPKPKPHEPRLLAPIGCHRRFVDEHAYVALPGLAMRDEPEALSEDDYARHVLGRATTAAEQQAAIEAAKLARQQKMLSIEERLVEAHAEARRRCMDVSREVRLVRDMLAKGKEPRHVESRLGSMERRVYREAA
jgi:hypothetical protein